MDNLCPEDFQYKMAAHNCKVWVAKINERLQNKIRKGRRVSVRMKRIKRTTGIILAAVLLLMMTAGNPAAAYANDNSIYRISAADELKQLFAQMSESKDFTGTTIELQNDIILEVAEGNNFNWTPAAYFNGTFNGNGHRIVNIRSCKGGLFIGLGENAVVENVILENMNLIVGESMGGIAKENRGLIKSCLVSGKAELAGGYEFGGIVKENISNLGVIANCVNRISVDSQDAHRMTMGGIAAVNNWWIENSYNAADLSVTGGYLNQVCGIAGRNNRYIANCYNIGRIAGNTCHPIAANLDISAVLNCYYEPELSGCGSDMEEDSGEAVGRSEMKQDSFLKKLNDGLKEIYSNNWVADSAGINGGFPILQWQLKRIAMTGISLDQSDITLNAGETSLIKVSSVPNNATEVPYEEFVWTSGDSSIAEIEGNAGSYGVWGRITAKKSGNCVIAVKTEDGKYAATCTVHVKEAAPSVPPEVTPPDGDPSNPSDNSPTVSPDIELPFTDVHEGDWYQQAAGFVYSRGIMTGMNETEFGPSVKLSRGQFATILYRMEGEPEAWYDAAAFPDVSDGQFFTSPAMWAKDSGVISGYDDGRFGPADEITREQMAVMMFRYANMLELDTEARGDTGAFPDADRVSPFADEAVRWAVGMGLIKGDGGLINPQGTAERAQCATIIMRFMEGYGL